MKLARLTLLTLSALLLFVVAVSADDGFPRTLVDGLGKEIVLKEKPARIFSGGLAMDNILLSMVDPKRVVGVTRYATDPFGSYVADKVEEHMVIIEKLNAEQIVAAKPDILLVASWSDQDVVKQLEGLGIKVYTLTQFSSVQDALDNIGRIGEITGNDENAEALVSQFYESYGRIAARVAGRTRPKVLSWGSWGSTTGLGTSMHDIIEMAGGVNVAAANGIEGWKDIDAEAIIKMNPEVIITSSGDEFVQKVLADGALQGVAAVKGRRVYHIDHTGALNHHVILAIEQLARKLHPEAF